MYFNPHLDTLFIDHETFFEDYEDLPSLIAEYILPSDLAQITSLAVEGLGAYQQNQYGSMRWGSATLHPYGEESSAIIFLPLLTAGYRVLVT